MINKLLFITLLFLSLNASDLVIKQSNCDAYQTTNILEKIIKSKNLDIFAKINHSANAKSVGMKLNPAIMLIFGKAQMGTKLMQQDPTAGLDLPLRILIYKDKDNSTKIAYRDGTWLKNTHIINAPKIIKKINNGLDKITNKAINECKK